VVIGKSALTVYMCICLRI